MPLTLEFVSRSSVLLRAAARLFRNLPEVLSGQVSLLEQEVATSELALRHAPGITPEELALVVKPLQPLALESSPDPSLPPGRICLRLGSAEKNPFENISVHLKANQEDLKDAIEDDLHLLVGSLAMPGRVSPVRRSKLLFGGAGPFARKATQLILLSHGIDVRPHREWSTSDMDLFVHVCSPQVALKPAIEHNPLRVFTDAPDEAEVLFSRLRTLGVPWRVLPLEALPQDQRGLPGTFRFLSDLQALDQEYEEQAILLRQCFVEALCAAGVSLDDMPLEAPQHHDNQGPSLVFPIGAFRSGQMRPYSTRHPHRFAVELVGDDPGALEPLRTRIATLGFHSTTISPPEAGRRRGRGPAEQLFPYLFWPSVTPDEVLQGPLRGVIHDFLGEHAKEPLTVEEREGSTKQDTIRLTLPIRRLQSEGMAGVLRAQAAELDVQVFSRTKAGAQAVVQELRRRGFCKIRVREERTRSRVGIFYGKASAALMTSLERWFSDRFSVHMPTEKVWSSHDSDVHLWLHESLDDEAPESPSPPARALDAWVHGEESAAEGPFLELVGDHLRVGDLRLPRPDRGDHPLIPPAEEFRHYVLDETTATTLRLLASAVLLREPCLLEGETSTSKTSAILYLALRLGQPVLRMNLNGQTDTSELIGRHVPASGEGALWCWQDGLVVEAMTRGYWLILDELNLAEPQVLERLNSVLERTPSLVLSEHDGRVLGPREVHPDFRVFATMNPATYAGRSPLSPAFRDRFRAYRCVPAPGEQDVSTFLRAAVHGEGGSVQVAGRRYTQPPVAPGYPTLGRSPWLSAALPSLARFHVSVTSAFRAQPTPGARERHAFTRRALLSLLDFLALDSVTEARFREALVRYYVERVPPDTQTTVIRLLDAVGLGPGNTPTSTPPGTWLELAGVEDETDPDLDLGMDLLGEEGA